MTFFRFPPFRRIARTAGLVAAPDIRGLRSSSFFGLAKNSMTNLARAAIFSAVAFPFLLVFILASYASASGDRPRVTDYRAIGRSPGISALIAEAENKPRNMNFLTLPESHFTISIVDDRVHCPAAGDVSALPSPNNSHMQV